MVKKTRTRAFLSVLMMVFLLIGMMPGVAMGDNTDLGWLSFKSNTDSTLITGVTSTINMKLYQDLTAEPFTGSVSATITDSEGNQTPYPVSGSPGSQGSYSISNVTILIPGEYSLLITQDLSNTGVAKGIIKVVNAVAKVTPPDPVLGWLNFMSSADSTLITGATSTINMKLYQDSTAEPFTGSVSATITDSEGNQTFYSVSGTQGNYSITNVTLDNPGDYSVFITPASPNTGAAGGTITVVNAVAKVTGSLIINTNNTLSVKVADSIGNPLARKAITVDGTAVEASAQAYTTLYDGTFKFSMTPSLYGTVNITYFGHVIGSISVVPAYTQNTRIGETAEDNVSLSVEVAKNGWAQGARNVILTRDDQFSDAMAAVPLSKKLGAPILMTDSAKLDDRSWVEMQNLGVVNVYIVGGTGAISQAVENQLKDYFTVTRIFGLDRYDTAAEISKYVGIEATHTVYIANGYAIPDAIAASAFAAEQGSSILLTDRDQLPSSTIQALSDLNVSNVVLLGGTAVIGTSVENELRTKYSVKRWGGNDRYDTQNIIFQNLLNMQTPQSPLYFTSGLVRQDDVSSGKPYADALLTAALAAKNGGFVAMLPPNTLPPSLNYFLLFNKGYISNAAVVGNFSAVSRDLEQQVHQILKR